MAFIYRVPFGVSCDNLAKYFCVVASILSRVLKCKVLLHLK